MKGRIFYSCLLIGLCFFAFAECAVAQSITTNALSASAVCAGTDTKLSIPFSTTGVFSNGNLFTAQLSDANGVFSGGVTTIGTLALSTSVGTTATISATIPKTVSGSSAYKIRVISSMPVLASTNSQPLAIITVPLPGTSTPSPYCEGDVATALVATPAAGGTLQWYGTNAASTPTTTATTPDTKLIGSTPYYVAQTISGCLGPQASITVVVNAKPVAPITATKFYCVNDVATSLTATAVGGGSLNWYAGPLSTTPIGSAPTPATSKAGSTSYYVSETRNGCEGPRASLVVTVNSAPVAPTVSTPSPFCQGSTPGALSAVAVPNATLRWWGTSASNGSFSTTPTVPDNQASATYYVSQVLNGCDGPRSPIVVTVKAAPALPGTAPIEFCQNAPVPTLTASFATGATPNWYGTNSSGGTSTTTPPGLQSGSAGQTTYYVGQTVDGCASGLASLVVTVKATPSAPGVSPVSYCNNASAQPLTASGTLIRWYDAADNQLSGTPTPATNSVGPQTFKATQTVNGCESGKAILTVTINSLPAAPAVSTPSPFCQGSTASPLSAAAVPNATLRWWGTSASNGSFSTTPTVPNNQTSATYYVSQVLNGCDGSRSPIIVTVKPTPASPGTAPIEFCQNAPVPTLTANFAAGATPNWYGTNSSGGTSTTTPPGLQSGSAGQTTYYVGQTVDGCASGLASLVVTVKPTPSAPGVSPVSYCNNASAQPLTASGSSIRWYDAGDNPLNGTPTPATNLVGDQTFRVTQTVNGCESGRAILTVTIKPLPGLPGVSNLTYCQAQQDQPAQNVTALTANGQNLRWYNPDGNMFPIAPTPPISQTGTFTYQVSQTVNNCESGKATLQVRVITVAPPTIAKPLLSYCINEKAAPLQATGEAGSTLQWLDPYGRLFSDAPTPSTLNTNVAPGGDAFYVYQVATNGCVSARATIKVLVNTTPTLSLNGSANVNLGQKTPLTLKFTGNSPFSYTITGGYSGVVNGTDTTISVVPRGNTTYQVIGVANSCGVGLPGNPATAVVTVNIPTITTSSLTSSTLCAGTSFVVPFTTTGTFTSGNSFRAELISVADTTKKYEVSTGGTSSPVTATLSNTLASGQYYVRVKGSNPDVGIIGTNSPTLIAVRSKPSATLAGSQTIVEGVPANLTITFGGEGPWTLTYADSLRSFPLTVSTSPYMVEVRPARTSVYKITSLSNTCGTGSVSGTAVVTVFTALGVEDTSLEPLVNVYPVPTGTTLTVAIDLALTREPAVLSLTGAGGQLIHQQTTRSRQTEIDLTHQPSGLYLLRVQVGDRQTIRKVLKQ